MRSYPDSDCEYERKEVEELQAESWQLELLKLNPSYCSWGPYEDYMCSSKKSGEFVRDPYSKDGIRFREFSDKEKADDYGKGWAEPIFYEGWSKFEIKLDELNEVVNFYFQVERTSKKCEACGQTGYNPATREISEGWYNHSSRTGKGWFDNITQDEVQALVDANRLIDFTKTWNKEDGWVAKNPPYVPTAAEVNEWAKKGMGHDSINHYVCVEARAKRLGVYGKCELCEGNGHVYTSPKAHVNLVLWVLHPRKGCSRGVEVKGIQRTDLTEVFRFLKQAADRNAGRFAAAVANL